jgi:hypothetical protein
VHTDPDARTERIRTFAGPDDAAGYRRLREQLTQLYESASRRRRVAAGARGLDDGLRADRSDHPVLAAVVHIAGRFRHRPPRSAGRSS